KVHEALGGTGVWAAQPEVREVEDLDVLGKINPIITGDYGAEQARWESRPIEVGRPLSKPKPLFAKLDTKLAETGPDFAPIKRAGPNAHRCRSGCPFRPWTHTPSWTPAGRGRPTT